MCMHELRTGVKPELSHPPGQGAPPWCACMNWGPMWRQSQATHRDRGLLPDVHARTEDQCDARVKPTTRTGGSSLMCMHELRTNVTPESSQPPGQGAPPWCACMNWGPMWRQSQATHQDRGLLPDVHARTEDRCEARDKPPTRTGGSSLMCMHELRTDVKPESSHPPVQWVLLPDMHAQTAQAPMNTLTENVYTQVTTFTWPPVLTLCAYNSYMYTNWTEIFV